MCNDVQSPHLIPWSPPPPSGITLIAALHNTLAKCILEKNIKPLCCSSLILKQTNSPLFVTFLRCCNEQGDHKWFFFIAWLLTEPKQETTCKLRYSVNLLLLLWRNVGLGVSRGFFQGLSTGLKPCSVQLLWTCTGKNFRVTRETFHFIFARLLFLSSSVPLTHATKATKDQFDVFQAKRGAIKSNLSSVRLPTSIYWLTTLGLQNMLDDSQGKLYYSFDIFKLPGETFSLGIWGKIVHTSKFKFPQVQMSTVKLTYGMKAQLF